VLDTHVTSVDDPWTIFDEATLIRHSHARSIKAFYRHVAVSLIVSFV
jgi:hypothetical protein